MRDYKIPSKKLTTALSANNQTKRPSRVLHHLRCNLKIENNAAVTESEKIYIGKFMFVSNDIQLKENNSNNNQER